MKSADIKLLIVDDEPDVLESLCDLFETFGFCIEAAQSGNSAWQKLQEKNFHLVLTDVRMADGNGIELAQKIRQKHPNQPTILLTSGYTDASVEELFNIGVDGFFAKPFDSTAVRTAIQRCLLKPDIRYSQTTGSSPGLVIEKRAPAVTTLEATKDVLFGRGGFFFKSTFSPPRIGSALGFEIEITEGQTIKLTGTGHVRWTIGAQDSNNNPGFGVEIESMPQDAAKLYIEHFANKPSYIPSPRLNLKFKPLI